MSCISAARPKFPALLGSPHREPVCGFTVDAEGITVDTILFTPPLSARAKITEVTTNNTVRARGYF